MAGNTADDVNQLATFESQLGKFAFPSSNTSIGGRSPNGPHADLTIVPFVVTVVNVPIDTYFLKSRFVSIEISSFK